MGWGCDGEMKGYEIARIRGSEKCVWNGGMSGFMWLCVGDSECVCVMVGSLMGMCRE